MISQPVVDAETMDSGSDSGIDFQYLNKRERNNVVSPLIQASIVIESKIFD